jgi:hypothetical protein
MFDLKLGFTVTPVLAVNKGASFGPRIATATFGRSRYESPRWAVRIVVDLDGAAYQDESAVRRRGGRAAVPVGRRAAKAIASGALSPIFEPRSRAPDWATASWTYEETFDGYSRRVTASADFNCAGDAHEPRLPEGLARKIADEIEFIADRLHTAIDDPFFAPLFGGR